MRAAIETDVTRLESICFPLYRFEMELAQIASEAARRDRGDVPPPSALRRHFVSKPAIRRDHVRVANRQEP